MLVSEPFGLFWRGTPIEQIPADAVKGFAGIVFEFNPEYTGSVVICKIGIVVSHPQQIIFELYGDDERKGEYVSPTIAANRTVFLNLRDRANRLPIMSGAQHRKWTFGFNPEQCQGYMSRIKWNGGEPCHNCWKEKTDSLLWKYRRPYISWARPTHPEGVYFHCEISIRTGQ